MNRYKYTIINIIMMPFIVQYFAISLHAPRPLPVFNVKHIEECSKKYE